MPVPSLTTLPIIVATSLATFADTARPSLSGFVVVIVRPPGPTMRSTSDGRIRMPPFAIAPATIAICSGVTCRVYWPIAVRAGSSLPSSGSSLPG